jgi:hypothetical protein
MIVYTWRIGGIFVVAVVAGRAFDAFARCEPTDPVAAAAPHPISMSSGTISHSRLI